MRTKVMSRGGVRFTVRDLDDSGAIMLEVRVAGGSFQGFGLEREDARALARMLAPRPARKEAGHGRAA